MTPSGKDNLSEEVAGGAAALFVPVIGPVLGKTVARSLRDEWKRNTSHALAVAEREADMTREDLAEFIEANPRGLPLYMRILYAAGMNGHDETLRAMGAVFGHAARAAAGDDTEGFEDAELALQAMSNLGPRHFRILRVLGALPPAEPDGGEGYAGAAPKSVAVAVGLREDVVNQCLINLAGAGLTTSLSGFGGLVYPITALGRAVVRAASAYTNGQEP